MEQVENVEAETVEEVEAPKPEEEAVAEVAAEAPVEAPIPEVATDLPAAVEPTEVVEPQDVIEEKIFEDVAMEDVVHQTFEAAEPMQDFVSAINKENTANEIADAVKMVSSKLGEQSTDSAVEGLAP